MFQPGCWVVTHQTRTACARQRAWQDETKPDTKSWSSWRCVFVVVKPLPQKMTLWICPLKSWDLSQRNGHKSLHVTRTIPSIRDKILSRHVAVLFARAITNKGSKRAASSSLATVRATLVPSVAPGGMRPPLKKASPTDSLTLLLDRERYCDSRVDNERSKRMVSGLYSVVGKCINSI